jgi:undecaprenyl diphosphate synthase
MSVKDKIKRNRLPEHVAIIMDGNGRWAKKLGNIRLFGHNAGVKSVREVTEASVELGIKYLTLYAFSTENWNRPQAEVQGLMSLLAKTLAEELATFAKNNVRLKVIGGEGLPENVKKSLDEAEKNTAGNTGLTLVLALSYSSRWEITKAVTDIAKKVEAGELKADKISQETISQHMSTNFMPDPELLIRTSGEYRISNFLLWQIAYSELYFTDVLWPDFKKENFYEALLDYQSRERRFGMTSEQVTK